MMVFAFDCNRPADANAALALKPVGVRCSIELIMNVFDADKVGLLVPVIPEIPEEQLIIS